MLTISVRLSNRPEAKSTMSSSQLPGGTIQDLPPQGQILPFLRCEHTNSGIGGFAPIQYKRNLPARGFRPSYYLLAVGALCSYGFYKLALVRFCASKCAKRCLTVGLGNGGEARTTTRTCLVSHISYANVASRAR